MMIYVDVGEQNYEEHVQDEVPGKGNHQRIGKDVVFVVQVSGWFVNAEDSKRKHVPFLAFKEPVGHIEEEYVHGQRYKEMIRISVQESEHTIIPNDS